MLEIIQYATSSVITLLAVSILLGVFFASIGMIFSIDIEIRVVKHLNEDERKNKSLIENKDNDE